MGIACPERFLTWIIATVLSACGLTTSVGADSTAPKPESFASLGTEYTNTIVPKLEKYCLSCHATDVQDGDLDLERFETLADVRQETKTWLKVAEMLDNGEMPPKEGRKLPAAERKALRGWIDRYLNAEAHANAGDPGPVVVRRLSNAEYTYTIRDLTGIDLRPAREFPADGAAGEGFTNAGNALVMSPALLTKYFDAAKGIAAHAVLLPDEIRFSRGTSRRDWTDETVARIREFYRAFTDTGGATQVNLQGIVFATNEGGRLPLEHYLAATLAEREALESGRKSLATVAAERGLNAKYFGLLWNVLHGEGSSLLLDGVRARWRAAGADQHHALTNDIGAWQKALWKFSSVGHIGKIGGPKAWMEPVSPLIGRQDVRLRIPRPPDGGDITLYLTAGDAGDGRDHDFVVWERPRLVAPGLPDLMLRDVRAVARALLGRREQLFAAAANCLRAAAEVSSRRETVELADLGDRYGVAPDVLQAWLGLLGLGVGEDRVKIDSHLPQKIVKASGYDFVQGWGMPDLPQVVANSSGQHVRIPGNMKPHGVAMHPTPALRVVAGWRSPVEGTLRVAARVQHAHPECGNGVTWSLELRHGGLRQRLAAGVAQGAKEVAVGPFEAVAVRPGDFVTLAIGPREGNHSCDLTAVGLTMTQDGSAWDLAADVSPDILAGNPHADRQGHEEVWHFFTEPDRAGDTDVVDVPAGSLLARWRVATSAEDKGRLGDSLQAMLTSGPPKAKDTPDAALYRQLASLSGPLLRAQRIEPKNGPEHGSSQGLGLDPAQFGHHPAGRAIDAVSLCVQAPAVVEVHLPADLVDGREFVVSAALAGESEAEGSAQVQVLTTQPDARPGPVPGAPILAAEGSEARRRLESAIEDFRQLFPPALCYAKIVPVDEVITLSLFYREDDYLRRLMLDDEQAAQLDRLWNDLRFVSQDALTLVDAFQQLLEYASQDADPKVFEPLRKPILDRAEAFKRLLVATEPRHVQAAIDLASRAYRRPLKSAEEHELRELYRKLRAEEIPHDDAIRLVLARVLVAPAFLYRVETPPEGDKPTAVSDWELASRLSYFLWSSLPDEELQKAAASGHLHEPDVLSAQARRLLRDEKVRRLATVFACQWLHVYDFDALDEKSERHFPTFAAMRGQLYEETIRLFTELFRRDEPVLSIFDADHTYLNEALAAHYGIPGVTGAEWRRVDGVRRYGRGGILGLGTTLAKQSGASRTSPILRGNWISEVLLGEKLPRPPKDVPRLPEDETATDGHTVRQLVERHASDERCAKCHVRIDPLGFALEDFDAIGRRRDKDLAGRPIETHSKLQDGTEFEGIDGLRRYLLTQRRDAVLRQFCRKLLGYALGRGVQLSDEPLLDEMRSKLESNEFRFSAAVETIVRSRQFREIRGKAAASEQ
jgi:hypothetical protein